MIEELTQAEAALLKRVDAVTGLMEDKNARLNESGVFAEYSRIHRCYVELIDDPSCGLEALKRALFIQWYAVSEPACFTGILEVAAEPEAKILSRLDEMTKSGHLDAELRDMLRWYYQVSDWYFERREQVPNLKRFLKEPPHEPPRLHKTDLGNRGQMTRYCQSLSLWRPR
jgi:hypothetical protein